VERTDLPVSAGPQDESVPRFAARWNESLRGFGVWDSALNRWASAPTFDSERVAAAVATALDSRSYAQPPKQAGRG
jgi:hypothetical protein